MREIHRRMSRGFGPVGRLIASLLVLVLATTAWGQQWDAPKYSSKDIDRMCRMLDMGEPEREAVRSLHESYLLRHSRAITKLNEYYAEVRKIAEDTEDWSIWDQTTETWEKFEKYHEGLCDELLADMKILLTSEQQQHWPRIERMFRRQRLLSRGFMRGMSVDLIILLENLSLEEVKIEELDAAMNRYEIELDEALMQFVRYYEANQKHGEELYEAGNLVELAKVYEEGRKLAVRQRNINMRHAESFARMLSPDAAKEFTDQFNKMIHPDVYTDTDVDRIIRTLKERDDLTTEQTEQIAEIESEFARKMQPANERLAKGLFEWEEHRTLQSWIGDDDGEPKSVELARKYRSDLEERTLERIKRLLTPAQLQATPQLRGAVELPVVNFGD